MTGVLDLEADAPRSGASGHASGKGRGLPLVYSCSGCSDVAQLANAIAVRLDRDGIAQMSCIAGVGGRVKPLVREAMSGRTIVIVDGCPLACCEKVLQGIGITPDHAVRLQDFGLRKRRGVDVGPQLRETTYATVREVLVAAGVTR